jgi:hypothetical protein
MSSGFTSPLHNNFTSSHQTKDSFQHVNTLHSYGVSSTKTLRANLSQKDLTSPAANSIQNTNN